MSDVLPRSGRGWMDGSELVRCGVTGDVAASCGINDDGNACSEDVGKGPAEHGADTAAINGCQLFVSDGLRSELSVHGLEGVSV